MRIVCIVQEHNAMIPGLKAGPLNPVSYMLMIKLNPAFPRHYLIFMQYLQLHTFVIQKQ